MKNLHELLGEDIVQQISEAPQFMGTRHPTWFPLFSDKPRRIDDLIHKAVNRVFLSPGGAEWLRSRIKYLIDFEDIDNASSALAEIRAYGGFLNAGFKVFPIQETDKPTPDFEIDVGEGRIAVEVGAKHQDDETDELQRSIHSGGSLPPGVNRSERSIGDGKLKMISTVSFITPAGKPDPKKPNDTVQANMVSKVCSIKQAEHQIPSDKPSILVMDFAHFGGPIVSQFFRASGAAPVETFAGSITCGPFWYGLYGWKGAPLFQAGLDRLVKMQHDGRFRLEGAKKSKLSAVLLVLQESSILLENPWAARRLPDTSRESLIRYPDFDLTRSIGDWTPGDAAKQIDLHKAQIETLEQHFQVMWG